MQQLAPCSRVSRVAEDLAILTDNSYANLVGRALDAQRNQHCDCKRSAGADNVHRRWAAAVSGGGGRGVGGNPTGQVRGAVRVLIRQRRVPGSAQARLTKASLGVAL